jgi:hypothetical protein
MPGSWKYICTCRSNNEVGVVVIEAGEYPYNNGRRKQVGFIYREISLVRLTQILLRQIVNYPNTPG